MEQVLLHKEGPGVYLRLSHVDGHYHAFIGNGERTESIVVPDYFIKKDKGVFNIEWTEAEFSLWFNDQKLGSIAYPPTPTSAVGTTYLGCDNEGNQWNGVLGPIKFSSEPTSNGDFAAFPQITQDTTVVYRADIYPENALVGIINIDERFSSFLFRGIPRGKIESPGLPLHYPTSMLWSEMQTYAWALEDQSDQGVLAEQQLYFHSSSGHWLDFWGGRYFGVNRFDGESDEAYAQRIVGEMLRPNQNNVALENILKDTMGIDASIRDVWHFREDLDPEDQNKAPGHFFLDMSLPGNLSPEDAEKHLERARSVVRRHKAAGTEFLETALRKLVALAEIVGFDEALTSLIEATYSESFLPGPVFTGAGWRVGTPGLKVGTNDPVKEQVIVRTIANDGNMTEQIYSEAGG